MTTNNSNNINANKAINVSNQTATLINLFHSIHKCEGHLWDVIDEENIFFDDASVLKLQEAFKTVRDIMQTRIISSMSVSMSQAEMDNPGADTITI